MILTAPVAPQKEQKDRLPIQIFDIPYSKSCQAVVTTFCRDPLCPAGMTTLEATIDAWALPEATAHLFKTWVLTQGWALDKPPSRYFPTITEQHLKDAGIHVLEDRLHILAELRPPGEPSVQGAASMNCN